MSLKGELIGTAAIRTKAKSLEAPRTQRIVGADMHLQAKSVGKRELLKPVLIFTHGDCGATFLRQWQS